MSAERPLTVWVADDEAVARRRLKRLIDELPGVVWWGESVDAEQARVAVSTEPVDLLLLDYHLPGINGIELLRALGEDGPAVVLCTAHPEHALAAFEGGAWDYLLKPVDSERLAKAIARVRARLFRPVTPLGDRAGGERPLGDRLVVPTARGLQLVAFSDVRAARVEPGGLRIETSEGPLFVAWTLAELERRLPAEGFLRVHRKALLRWADVVRLEDLPTGGYDATLRGGHVVEVSRQAARALRRALGLRGEEPG